MLILRRTLAPAVVALVALVAACSSDKGTSFSSDNLGIARTASYSSTRFLAVGRTDTLRFVASRTGPVTVKACGPGGSNFDLVLANDTTKQAVTSSNCETLFYETEAGSLNRIALRAVSGGGQYTWCYSQSAPGGPTTDEFVCSVTAPPALPADNPNIPAGYYASIEGLRDTALLRGLYEIVRNQRVLGYTAARESLYKFVEDVDDDDVVIDVYAGRAGAGVNSIATASAVGFNTEHAWPQSRGADLDPPESDLNHIFPSDGPANAQRSNNPFGVVTGTVFYTTPAQPGSNEQSRLGRDAAGRTVFEVRNSKKGDIARAILYFYVRYRPIAPLPEAKDIPAFLANFNVEEAVLLRWSQDDPPDDFERARNERVFRAQGNRNPFIDKPSIIFAIGDFPNN